MSFAVGSHYKAIARVEVDVIITPQILQEVQEWADDHAQIEDLNDEVSRMWITSFIQDRLVWPESKEFRISSWIPRLESPRGDILLFNIPKEGNNE